MNSTKYLQKATKATETSVSERNDLPKTLNLQTQISNIITYICHPQTTAKHSVIKVLGKNGVNSKNIFR